MTEKKRFTLRNLADKDYGCEEIADNCKKESTWITYGELVECLNHLHKENEFLKIKNERTQEYLRQKDKRITDLIIKKEDAEYELLHLKEKYEELLEEKERYKKEMLYFKRELQKELVCQAFIEGGRR